MVRFLQAVGSAVIILLMAVACMSPQTSPVVSESEPTREELFRGSILEAVVAAEKTLNARIALAFADSATTPLMVSYRGDELFHAASTMKVPVMIEVFRQAEQGLFALEDPVLLDPICHSFIDGTPFECDAGANLRPRLHQTATVRELCHEMITVSDNLATNLLIARCGYQRINATIRQLGVDNGYVLRGVQDEQAFQAGISNRLSANGLTQLMAAIDQHRAASPAGCAAMADILRDQKYRTMIPAGVPAGVEVGNKTGSITAHRHDTAIVYAPFGNYYLTILMSEVADPAAAVEAAAELSRLVWRERAALAESEP